MRLLVDTNAMLWALQDSPQLGVNARMQLMQAEVAYVSAASTWEARIKAAKGNLLLPDGFLAAIAATGFKELAITWEQSDQIDRVQLPHGDPFDRLLLIQAQQEQLIFLTADKVLLMAYPDVCLDARG